MLYSTSHLITYFIFLTIPFVVSLTFNFTNIDPQNLSRDIVIEGNGANITAGEIQLTPNVSNQVGRATYSRQLHLWDKASGELASFTTNFTFVIDSNGRSYYGDGFTFFLAQNKTEIYPGGSMGLPIDASPENINTTTQFVAVEFDTFSNRFWDPLTPEGTALGDHVGISISSVASVRYQKWSSNLPQGGVCQAWIKYDSDLRNLSVSFTGFRDNTPFRQDGLSYNVDLRKVLPEHVIFGFSASTGALQQNSKVRSWTFDSSNLSGDKIEDVPPTPIRGPVPRNGTTSKLRLVLALVVGIPVTITLLVGLVFVLWWKKKGNMNEEVKETGSDVGLNNEYQMGTGPKRFSYRELAKSTDDFAENKKLGEGGFGGVYIGILEETNTYIAVKRVSKSSKQGINEYASEVRIISRLRHRNMVQLLGWCHEKGNLLLVYQYMENGSLDSHLFKEQSLLTWNMRYKIAHGLASSLLYLHEEWEQCILHRDIKSSNVMLDSKFNAKLGDFGLAKLVDHEKGAQTTKLAGTMGYMAPECVMTGKATKESDIFSFGVVMLEIACGRKPIDYKVEENKIWLLEWIWELYGADKILEAVDPRLGFDFDEEEIKNLISIALWCVHPDPELRPSMRQVIQVLNSEASLPILPSKMVVSTYWKPSVAESHSENMISNRDSSNNSIFIGR